MTKDEYLLRLKQKLYWNIEQSKIKEIIEDYNEYFDSGISDGSSEEELCILFGDPALLAKNLLREVPHYRTLLWIKGTYSLLLFVLGFLLLKSVSQPFNITVRNLMLQAFLLLPLLHPFAFSYPDQKPLKRTLWLLGVITFLSLSAVLFVGWFSWHSFFLDYLTTIIDPWHIGPIISGILWFSHASLIAIIITIFTVKHKGYYIGLILANTSLFAAGNLLLRLLHALDDPNALHASLYAISCNIASNLTIGIIVLLIRFCFQKLRKQTKKVSAF